eukprot:UN16351
MVKCSWFFGAKSLRDGCLMLTDTNSWIVTKTDKPLSFLHDYHPLGLNGESVPFKNDGCVSVLKLTSTNV